MTKLCILIIACLSVAGPAVAEGICRLELVERDGAHLAATLTKTADAAEVEYDPQSSFLYPFTFDCVPAGARVCVTEKPWSLHAISFEYPPYAITLSVLDRAAYGTAETEINIRLWRLVNCSGDLELW